MPYGVANRTGQPSASDAAAILHAARAVGIAFYDTAQAYGASEELLGRHLGGDTLTTIATKTLPRMEGHDAAGVRRAVRVGVELSGKRLRRRPIPIVLLHDAAHLHAQGGAARSELELLRDEGAIGRLGASVYTTAQAWDVLDEPSMQVLELPVNALDARFADAGVLKAAAQRGVTVVARSVFLQGLLLMDPTAMPPGLQAARGPVEALRGVAGRVGLPLSDLLLRHALGQTSVTVTLIGAETVEQVEQNAKAARAGPLDTETAAAIAEAARGVPAWILDPSAWPDRAVVTR